MAKFILDIPSVQTDITRVEIEANSIQEAIDLALYSDEGEREIVETILDLSEDQVIVHSTGALNLVGYKWSMFRTKGKTTH